MAGINISETAVSKKSPFKAVMKGKAREGDFCLVVYPITQFCLFLTCGIDLMCY